MWDMEPDGRITSGCAYERANTLFMSYAADLKFESTVQPKNSPSLFFHSNFVIPVVLLFDN